MPTFRLGKIPEPVGFFLMGAAIAWVMQIHMSWPLLLPYVALAWLSGWRRNWRSIAANTVAFACGLLLFAVFLIPTFVVFGMQAGSGGTLRNLRPHWVNPWVAVTTLARLFSFRELEIWRFITTDDGKRLMFLLRHLWIAPLAVVSLAGRSVATILDAAGMVSTRSPFTEWRSLKMLVVATVALVYASYWFVLEPAQAHAFYVVAPVAFVYAAYCWTFVDSPRWRRIAGAVLAVNIAFHAGQAWIQAPVKSLYRNREVVAAAIRLKQPQMFAHRRAFAIDGGPPGLQDPSRPHAQPPGRPAFDTRLTMGPRRVALWTVTLRNGNERVAYRDVLYQTHYRDASGKIVAQRYDYIKEIFQPGARGPAGTERWVRHRAVHVGDDRGARRRSAAAARVIRNSKGRLPLTARHSSGWGRRRSAASGGEIVFSSYSSLTVGACAAVVFRSEQGQKSGERFLYRA